MKVPRRARGYLVIGLSLLLFLTTPLTSGMVAAQATPDEMDVDQVVMTIDIQENGDAKWTVEYRSRLSTEQEREDFGLIRGMVEQNPEDYETDLEAQMNTTLAAAENKTTREMELQNVSVHTDEIRFPQTYGIIKYDFTWSNFAAISERDGMKTIEMDAVLSEILIDSNTRLVVKWPETYDRIAVEPTPDTDRESNNEVTWAGPIEFEPNEPRLVAETSINGSNPVPSDPPKTDPQPEPEESWVHPLLIGGAVVAVVGISGAYMAQRREWSPAALWAERSGESAVPADSETDSFETNLEDAPANETEEVDETESDEGGNTVDLELLSNEEQVIHLLENNDGRMKQQKVVEETGWSAAKTSNVLNEMHENDEIDKFRLGRENVVAKPESSQTDAATTE